MKLFTWESFSVNRWPVNGCFGLLLSFITILLCIESNYAADKIANITVESSQNEFKIRDKDQSDKVIGTFKIDIINETIHLTDKGLEFNVKITPTIDVIIKYKNEEIKKTEEGTIFTECIGYYDLHNHGFPKTLKFSSEKVNLRFEDVKLYIDPIIELKIESSDEVNFGKILWNKGYVTVLNSPIVCFSYSILKNTTCKVESKNDFKLKHENKNEFIEYSLKIQGAAKQDLNIDENNEFQLSNREKEFSAQFDIKTFMRHIPTSGSWEDTVTFSIVCYK